MATILVVEDEPIVGLQLKESIEAMGYEVPAILDSGDAVPRAVFTYEPDLILMDIKLRSSTDGIDAARRIKSFREIPIIYLTAYPERNSEERAKATFPCAYLVKPVSDATLKASIEKALTGEALPACDD